MKNLINLVFLLSVLSVAMLSAEEVSTLVGTWINPEYNATHKTPKFVYSPDGRTIEAYATTYAKRLSKLYSYTVEETWQDSDGAQWYKVIATRIQTVENRFVYLLIRISPDGLTYEEDLIRGNLREFAEELNPESYFYKKFERE